MIKNIVLEKVESSLDRLGFDSDLLQISHPANESFGDYTTNIALQLAKIEKKSPMVLAKLIADKIIPDEYIEKVEVMKPGFINFWIKIDYLLKNANSINPHYGNGESKKNKKIMLEFTDPNPFKEMHIGHLYSNTIGESLSRLHESQGAIVKRVNYQGDVGMHVAKSIWGLQKKMASESITLKELEDKKLSEKINFLGNAYSIGSTSYESDKDACEEMKTINFLIYASAQSFLMEKHNWKPQVDYEKFIKTNKHDVAELKNLYEKGRQWSLDYFEIIYRRLGTIFDYYYFESMVGEYGVKIVKEYLEKGVFELSEGAIVFPGKKYNLHTRVFINSLGLPTYEAKELGLAPTKFKMFPYDQSLIITGSEIREYFKVLIAAMGKIYPELAKKTVHIGHGMVRLPEGKMSSRTGKVLTAEWLLNEVKDKLKIEVDKSAKVEKSEFDSVSEKLNIAAIKYSFLKQNIGNDIAFDFNESLSFQGNSGPYLEYTFARCKSIISRLSSKKDLLFTATKTDNLEINIDETSILRKIIIYPEIVEESAQNYAPNYICTYLYDLAQKYNFFYQKHQILKEVNEDIKNLRLLITASVSHVLNHGLGLLGIQTVEKM